MKYAPYFFATLVVALSTAWTIAQECCVTCGCNTCIRKVCHVKCEIKKVPKTEYCCECEDFCVPGPSKKCGHECTVDCRGCEQCKVNWVPQCAKVHTRHKLKKTTVDKEEKVYKWVVETFCEQCATHCVTSEAQLRQLQNVAATETPSTIAADSGNPVQPASFTMPVSSTPAMPQVQHKRITPSTSWTDSLKLPWQR